MAICFVENVINDHPSGTLILQFIGQQNNVRDKTTGEPVNTKEPITVDKGREREFEELLIPWAIGDQQLLVTANVNGTKTEHRYKISHGSDSWDYLRSYAPDGRELAAIEIGSVGNTKGVNWSGWEVWLDSRGRVRLQRKWRQGLSHKHAVTLGVGLAGGALALPGLICGLGAGMAGIAAGIAGGLAAGPAGAAGAASAAAVLTMVAGGATVYSAGFGVLTLGVAAFEVFWTAFAPEAPDNIRATRSKPLPDVAAGKQAYASSTFASDFAPGRATDDRSPESGGWSPAADDKGSFWQVDLGQPYPLNAIQLVTRQDLDQPETRTNFEIWASNHADMSHGHVVLASQGVEPGPFRSTLNLQVSDPTPYRYVAAVKTKPEYFFIAKLRAFARPTDLAAGKPATASSVLSSEYGPEKANDGGSIHSGGWAPTRGESNSFWQVDLGQAHALSRIDLVTRQDVDEPETRQNFEIWASNNADMSHGHVVLARQGKRPRPFREVFMAEIDDPTPYRYIAAVKTQPESFFIAKLLVYGRD